MAGRVGVLALQGAFREHVRACADVGLDAVEVRLPRDLATLDGLVIPGGESTTIGKLIEAYGLEPAIRDLAAREAPILGTCAGMITVARHAVDGIAGQRLLGLIDIDVRRNAFGRQVASFEAELELEGEEEPLTGVFIRAPWIERAGQGVEVLARHAGHPVAAREGAVMVTAFHPELTLDRRLHARFAELVEAARERPEAA